jgi:hypothetical protein
MSDTDELTADVTEESTEATPYHSARRGRPAAITFAVLLAVALPLIVLRLGTYHWFFRDDWLFIADRGMSLGDLFEPGNAHWNTLPLIEFRALFQVFGVRTYLPYQTATVLLHLTAAVLLRVVMRRTGVRPWIATAAASVFVLFGPGATNILWAFQTGFDGSLVFGLTQLLLADHDGPIDRRDWLGLLAGLVGLMCSAIAVPLVVAVGVATLLRRGWRIAAFHVVPLTVVYLTYVVVEDPNQSPFGRPPLDAIVRWLSSSVEGTFHALGHGAALGVVLAAMLIVGWAITFRREGASVLRGPAALPFALVVGGLAFATTTAFARWGLGHEAAKAGRYLYLDAAFVLPALAFAADAISTRWKAATIPVIVLLLLPIPWHATSFEDPVFNRDYFAAEKRILLTAPRMPFATEVPRDVRPMNSQEIPVSIGFLLDAQRDGRLPHDDAPIADSTTNELKVRLGVAQRGDDVTATSDCRTVTGNLDLSPARGDVFRIKSPVTVATFNGKRRTSPLVEFFPQRGRTLTVELPDLDLRLAPLVGNSSFELCS